MVTVLPPIPDSEARQAIDAIGGYAYQLYQSLLAWIALDETEMLFLEVAEDYAVATSEKLEAVQVRNTKENITLAHAKVIQTLNNYWVTREKNKGRRVRYRYLTTSKIGKEAKLKFPDDKPGLEYWREAAKPGVNIEPLREALLQLDLIEPLKAFIKTATPEELKEHLLIPINWDTNNPDSESLAKQAEALVTAKAQDIVGSPVSQGEILVNCLLGELLITATQKDKRELPASRVNKLIDEICTVKLGKDLARGYEQVAALAGGLMGGTLQLQTGQTASEVPPLPSPLIARKELIKGVKDVFIKNGIIFIHGTSGKGKSTLAKLLVEELGGEWSSVDLRDRSPESASLILGLAAANFKPSSSYMLDDLSLENEKKVEKALSVIAQKASLHDRLVVVTTNSKPSARLLSQLKISGSASIDMPDLTVEEVSELVDKLGGEGAVWGPITHALCGGHPQLVVARLSSLAEKGWPKSEILAGLYHSKPAAEIDEERANVRKQIINELDADKRALLERLSIILGRFDISMVQAACDTPPPVKNVLDNLELLQGQWIEKMEGGYMRLSPLLSGLARHKLSQDQIRDASARIANNLIIRSPIEGALLSPLLLHALIGKHVFALAHLSRIVLESQGRQRRYITAQLGGLEALQLENPILPENPHVSLFLRLAQFKVAVDNESYEHADAIAQSAIAEAQKIPDDKHGAEMRSFAQVMLLSEDRLPFSLTNWLGMLTDFVKVRSSTKSEFFDKVESSNGKLSIDVAHFFFALNSSKKRTIADLEAVFTQLGDLEKSERDYLLNAFETEPADINVFIANAWLHEEQTKTLNAEDASQKFLKLADMAHAWGHTELAVQCVVASSVMQDEYVNQREKALDIVDEAIAKYGPNIALVQQKAKVLHNSKMFAEALKVYDLINPETLIPLDQFFTFRTAAMSAGKAGDWKTALKYFKIAEQGADRDPGEMKQSAVYIKGDLAECHMRLGDIRSAVRELEKAVIAIEEIGEPKTDQEKYGRAMIGHMLSWCDDYFAGKNLKKLDEFAPGRCSNPNYLQKVLDLQPNPIEYFWYFLAKLEGRTGADLGLRKKIDAWPDSKRILILEHELAEIDLQEAIRSRNIPKFVKSLQAELSALIYVNQHAEQLKASTVAEPVRGMYPLVKLQDMAKPLWGIIDRNILRFALSCIFIRDYATFDRFVSPESELRDIPQFERISTVLRGETRPTSEEYIAGSIAKLRIMKGALSLREKFTIQCRCLEFLKSRPEAVELSGLFGGWIGKEWIRAINNSQEQIQMPLTTIPMLEANIRAPRYGYQYAAAVLLSANAALGFALSKDFADILKRIAFD